MKKLRFLLLFVSMNLMATPGFKKNQCVVLDQNTLPDGMYTENIPMTIRYIDSTKVKLSFYYKLDDKKELFIVTVGLNRFYKHWKHCEK